MYAATNNNLIAKGKIFQDPNFFDMISAETVAIATEASKDYDTVISAINNKQKYIVTDNAYLSLESYLVDMKAKYQSLGVSLEEDEVKEEKKSSSGDGFFAKVKSVIKSILDFFYNLFISIKDKFLSLFGITKKNKESQIAAMKNDFPEAIKEAEARVEVAKKNIDKLKFEGDVAYLEKYVKTGELTMAYSPRSFNIGTSSTEKEFNTAIKDLSLSISTSTSVIDYYQKTASVLFAAFKEIVETGKPNEQLMFSAVLGSSIGKVYTVIDGAHFSAAIKDGSRILGKVGGTYLTMPGDSPDGELPRVIARLVAPIEGDYKLTFNRTSIEVYIRDFIKITDGVNSLIKTSNNSISSVEGYLKDIKAVVLKNEENMQDPEILKELKSIEKFMNDILARTGTIVKFCVAGGDFIFNTIEHMVKENSKASKKLQAYIPKDKE